MRLPVYSRDYREHWGAFFFPRPPSDGGCPARPGHLITYNSDVVQPLQIDLTSSPAHNWPKYWYFPGSMATVVQWPLWSPNHPPHVHISSCSAILGTDEWPDNERRATNGNKTKSIGGNSCLLLVCPFWSINDKFSYCRTPLGVDWELHRKGRKHAGCHFPVVCPLWNLTPPWRGWDHKGRGAKWHH